MGLHLAALAELADDVELATPYDIEMRERDFERRELESEKRLKQLEIENKRLAELECRLVDEVFSE